MSSTNTPVGRHRFTFYLFDLLNGAIEEVLHHVDVDLHHAVTGPANSSLGVRVDGTSNLEKKSRPL